MDEQQLATIQELYVNTLGGKWNKVVEIYKKHRWTHTTKITASEDTALHVAVNNGEEDIVKQLVNEIKENEKQGPERKEDQWKKIERERKEGQNEIQHIMDVEERALEMKNARGDTPLHLAASRGFAGICWIIAENDGDFLISRNNKGETPIFLAALNWHRDAFLCLHKMYTRPGRKIELHALRRDNGDTVLHCAIQREHFDLAVIIVEFYRDLPLVGSVNKRGYSPLKMLATRPAAFKSGSNLRMFKYILYHCIPVDEMEVIRSAKKWSDNHMSKKDFDMNFPQNYLTCYHFITSFRKLRDVCAWSNMQAEEDTESQASYDYQHHYLPKNYATVYDFMRSTLGIIGYGLSNLKKMKEKHVWSLKLLKALMEKSSKAYMEGGNQPIWLSSLEDVELGKDPLLEESQRKQDPSQKGEASNAQRKKDASREEASDGHRKQGQKDKMNSENKMDNGDSEKEMDKNETALLIAAKNGILEMVKTILEDIPVAIHDTTSDNKNILLVAVENRQPYIIKALRQNPLWNNLVLGMDSADNTIMHLAAKSPNCMTWQIPGSAMNMLWDIKWYQYVKSFAPKHFLFRDNNKGKTPAETFTEEHTRLVNESSNWLKDTSQSCSLVAALIAGVAFATSSTIPGGNNEKTGKPNLGGQPAFELFAITSLAALCFSITALIMFLAILTSRKDVQDFRRNLALKLLLGLSSLFVSIASMLVSFCAAAAHFFVLKDKFKEILFPIYVATCLPISFYAVAQFPLYVDLLRAILTKVPQPKYKEDDL